MLECMRHALLLFLAITLQAQSSAPALLEEARSQPVEVFADIAFQLLPRLSPAAKTNTLTEIFGRAGEARSSFPSRYPDIDALDALSLRSRAVRTILSLDGKRGRQLFESMSYPNVPRPTCEEVVAPNAGIYMDTVEAVFRQGQFSDSEREKRVPWTLVIDAVRGAGSAAEIAAASQRLAPFARSEREQAEMTAALAFGLSAGFRPRVHGHAADQARRISCRRGQLSTSRQPTPFALRAAQISGAAIDLRAL